MMPSQLARAAASVPGTPPEAAPIVLTTAAFEQSATSVVAALAQVGFTVRTVDAVEQMLQDDRTEVAAVVLVDLDTRERLPHPAPALSRHRLVTLLAQHVRRQRGVLAVQTLLDFAEIEDIVRAGVHAILDPRAEASTQAAQVYAAYMREHSRRASGMAPAPPVRLPAGVTAHHANGVAPGDLPASEMLPGGPA